MIGLMDTEVISKLLERRPDSHKYQFGHVLVVGGAPGMVGAPLLAGMAALRSGAGLVTIAAAAAVADKLERRVQEIMTLALPVDATAAASHLEDFIARRKVSVLVIGPGLSVTPRNRSLVGHLLDNINLPVIVDGGALSTLQHHLDRLDDAASDNLILTPHAGEFQRLYGKELPAERSELKPVAVDFAKDHALTLVLKGHPTYVAQSNGAPYENSTGNPGLATAGTGDVLSGMIAGLVAQGIAPQEAVQAGVYLHGLAGDIAAAAKTEPGMIASDVIDAIPAALKRAQEDGRSV